MNKPQPVTVAGFEDLMKQRPARIPGDAPIGILDDRGHFRPVTFGGWRCVEDRTNFSVDTLCLVMLPDEP